jgi:hypothetical protein
LWANNGATDAIGMPNKKRRYPSICQTLSEVGFHKIEHAPLRGKVAFGMTAFDELNDRIFFFRIERDRSMRCARFYFHLTADFPHVRLLDFEYITEDLVG